VYAVRPSGRSVGSGGDGCRRLLQACACVASAYWQWSEEEHATVIGIRLVTDAYELQRAGLLKTREIRNRPEDLAWARQKLAWLWQASRAEGPMPPVVVDEQ